MTSATHYSLPSTSKEKCFKSPITTPILPPETWSICWTDLPLPDFVSVINTCMEWNELLHSQKEDRLLPLVLPIIFDYLPLTSILQCRLMKKSVKEIVDAILSRNSVEPTHILEYDPSLQDGVYTIRSRVTKIQQKCRVDLFGETNVSRFMAQAETHLTSKGNPFLTGRLSLNFGGSLLNMRNPELINRISSLLRRFGEHVTSLHISILHVTDQDTVPVATLYSILRRVSNLRDLRISASIPNDQVENFGSCILPHLPHLVSLNLTSFSARNSENDFSLIFPFLHRYGSQLKVFRCAGRLLSSTGYHLRTSRNTLPFNQTREANFFLPNLTHVKIDAMQYPALSTFGFLTWNDIEMLSLAGFPKENGQPCNFWYLMELIKKFEKTLTTLELLFMAVDGFRHKQEEILEGGYILPKLRKLTTAFENGKEEWFLEFLRQSCMNVEELHFQVTLNEEITYEDWMGVRIAFKLVSKLRKIVFWFCNRPKFVVRR